MTDRYVDKGYRLLHWATSIEALCPKCGETGLIKGNPKWKEWSATFHCPCCFHSLKTTDNIWLGPVRATGSRPCCSCGHKWVTIDTTFSNISQIKSMTAATQCAICKSPNQVSLEFSRTETEDHGMDPYFGLKLALTQQTRHGIIWVYDAEHLAQLKAYVTAKLRESSDEKWSYFNRLPTWIKSAKTRQEVLKAVAKLEQRLKNKRA